jgi:hypothetical protein
MYFISATSALIQQWQLGIAFAAIPGKIEANESHSFEDPAVGRYLVLCLHLGRKWYLNLAVEGPYFLVAYVLS